MDAIIDFKSLGLSPELYRIGFFALRWYSLAYIFGVLFGWYYLRKLVTRSNPAMTLDDADDFVFYAFLGIMIGGRVGHVLFYAREGSINSVLDVFAVWEGGMAFHGGFAGVVIAIAIFAWQKKLNWLRIADYMACVYPIGHFLGRLANFVNGELWGRPTEAGWGIIFPDAGPEARHPSQLYQAGLEGLLPFMLLFWLFWRTDIRNKPGALSACFLFSMGGARFICEFYREPDRHLGILPIGLTMGQVLTVAMFVIGLALIWVAKGRKAATAP